MKVLFIADPMASFKTYKDTTYAMMREMAKRGWQLFHTLSGELSVREGLVVAQAAAFEFVGAKNDDDHEWFKSEAKVQTALKDFDAVIMRTDPPFDMQYLYATQFLTLAEQQGAKVFNSGQAMRDFNEKLAILKLQPVYRAHFGYHTFRRCPCLFERTRRHHHQTVGRHGWYGHFPSDRIRPQYRQYP